MIDQKLLLSKFGKRHPGRLSIRTQLINQAKPKEVVEVATKLVKHLEAIYIDAQIGIRRVFNDYVNNEEITNGLNDQKRYDLAKDIYNDSKDFCYPYILIHNEDISKVNLRPDLKIGPHDKVLHEKNYYSEFAEPSYIRSYLLEEIISMLSQGYNIEVGLSYNPIPVLYAVERAVAKELTKGKERHIDLLPYFFAVPDIAQINDSVADSSSIGSHSGDGKLSPEKFSHFTSYFWSTFFDKLGPKHSHSIEKLPGFRSYKSLKKDTLTGYFVIKDVNFDVNADLVDTRFRAALEQSPSLDLSLYSGRRIDYSITRINHYTKTDARYFQRDVLFVNYQKYFWNFLLLACSCLVDDIASGPNGWLVISGKHNKNVPDDLDFEKHSGLHDKMLDTQTRDHPIGFCITKKWLVDKIADDEAIEQLKNYRSMDGQLGLPETSHSQLKTVFDKLQSECISTDCQMPSLHFYPDKIIAASDNQSANEAFEFYQDKITEGVIPPISLVNIGVGPSNAKTITDHIAVLRPRSWMMVGHCGGVRRRQKLGHYVIGDSCYREDSVLRKHISDQVPTRCSRHLVDALVTSAQYQSHIVDAYLNKSEYPLTNINRIVRFRAMKQSVRTGTIYTTDDRNWETRPMEEYTKSLNDARAVGVDMESATIVANGYRHRVHAGSLLCVSDKPLHGAVKMKFFSDEMYLKSTSAQLKFALNSYLWFHCDKRSELGIENSRELESINNPPFR